jgi:hypothetical protein
MGNCTGYCTGCKEDGQRYDNNQVRNSYKEKDMIIGESFGGERYSGNQEYINGGTQEN